MVGCQTELAEFYDLILKGLKDKIACILFQFPPSFLYNEERLNSIIINLDKRFCNIVEFRHESWWREGVYQQLNQNKVTFCNISHPTLPDYFVSTSPVFYLRLHGTPDLYKSSYKHDYLDKISYYVKEHTEIKKAYLYFNI